jgi:hypothetical protein
MKKIIKNDPTKIDTTFVVSLFCEDYFKELIDEYVSKVLVCGKAPSAES